MKYELSNTKTKKAFAEALKELLLHKPFSKITVSELVDKVKMNRKTFYYHFEDIYDLLRWTFEQETLDIVKNYDFIAEHDEAIIFTMDYIEKNEIILTNIYNSIGRDEITRFLRNDYLCIVRSIIDQAENAMSIKVSDEYKNFLCVFYTEALSGVLIDWLIHKSSRNREKTINFVTETVRAGIRSALIEGQTLN